MVNYRRHKTGNVCFFTVTLKNRKSGVLVKEINLLGHSMREVNKEYPFKTKAIVVLPDHLHCIWELPNHDLNFSLRWQKIKRNFTVALRRKGVELNKNKRGEYDLWQSRFWEHILRNERDLENHINYIHYNPVKHSLVRRVIDWPYSSFHHYVNNGILKKDWAGDDVDGEFGE